MKQGPDCYYANLPRAGLGRRLGAACYDLLLAAAVYVFAGILGFAFFALTSRLGITSVASDQALADVLRQNRLYHGVYQCWLMLWVLGFYCFFWSHAGQTLGMQVWRLRVQHTNGQNISPVTALARAFWSLLGLGNIWLVFSQQRLALQDKLTDSEIVQLPKP
ncbi:RDD family protein [Shewanella yunxiaonensis]|uniref:RDD family protein n=1 Tax=Shewanella yunxiaonensis TaxID=2829809 RepID=A0ABX7YRU0_9GAMM|nr:RDD family protein [Shewanella yunxiaonensis]QUN05059.1 RDD family protein [Shewanella yunxiaonensis]